VSLVALYLFIVVGFEVVLSMLCPSFHRHVCLEWSLSICCPKPVREGNKQDRKKEGSFQLYLLKSYLVMFQDFIHLQTSLSYIFPSQYLFESVPMLRYVDFSYQYYVSGCSLRLDLLSLWLLSPYLLSSNSYPILIKSPRMCVCVL